MRLIYLISRVYLPQGAVLLGEAIDRVDFFCAMISYVGVVFVARPAMLFPQASLTKETNSIAILAALGAAATQACAYICMRKLHAVHYMAISHYFSLFGIAFSFATLWFFGVVRSTLSTLVFSLLVSPTNRLEHYCSRSGFQSYGRCSSRFF
jgi:drug/metabolite transporter (DMT)-like permease